MPADQPPFLLLGQVQRPHGVRGELRIEIMTAYPDRIVPGMEVYMGTDPQDTNSAVIYKITNVRSHQHLLILRLEGVDDRESADLLRKHYVMVTLEDAVPLEEGEYYLYQVIGLRVRTEDGEDLGQVAEVIETGANDVYVINGPRGEILLPAIDECVREVDIEGGSITVHLLDGLLND